MNTGRLIKIRPLNQRARKGDQYMDTKTIVKTAACVVGAVVAVTLFSQHPVPVVLLAVCAGAYIYAQKKLA